MLSVEGLSVAYEGGGPVVAPTDLAVREGGRLVVCGAAGSGKSSLLSAIAGVVPRLLPARVTGTVRLDHTPIATMPRSALFRAVGVVFQNLDDQLWDLGVEDLVAFPLENRGVARAEVRGRVRELLRALGVADLTGRRVLTLSGGERRMVALAAALAPRPRLLVLDEATTGLDPAARARLVGTIDALGPEIPMLVAAEQGAAAFGPVATEVALQREGALVAMAASAAALSDSTWIEAGLPPPRVAPRARPAATLGPVRLEVAGLRTELKRPDGRPVVEDAGFSIRGGEVVGLVGRNGAGKTTLFQTLLGLSRRSAGRIAVDGEDATGWTPARRARAVGYLPQNVRRLIFNLTLLEEAAFAVTGDPKSARTPEARETAAAALAAYGLATRAEDSPFALSTRAQGVLGLACLAAARPAVVVLDEPLIGGDLAGRAMLDRFLAECRTEGRGVLIVSHDLDLVDALADRLLVLADGRIAYDGPTAEGWRSAAFKGLGWPAPERAEAVL
ncbi:ABC transporter ATP-binding protein [Pseudoxanthobacter sp. M-2]|uniref:ATP-binding cassette domain-containing protein n=1 Tax=Pseudoxanthobacter sp. M-2 TaxID=3078754 RepID=UPI0038FD10EC